MKDHRTAPITETMKAILTLVEKASLASPDITAEDIAKVRAAGASEEMIYDAITVCSLFVFYNTWVDACGVAAMPDEGYRASGARLASRGYIP
ncbi:MAG TPA: peroxidase [Thermoanaerobaculia bacterium]|nr:peroxidase [Thermoanaerobaculia bacterium]